MVPLSDSRLESFAPFYRSWIRAQGQMMQQLSDALNGDIREAELAQMVNSIVQHCQHYYEARERACHLTMSPTWNSPLETAFMWLGGWRPSLAFQLLYAIAGQQILTELQNFLDGVDTPSLASLTPSQLSTVSALQMATTKEEDKLEEQMAELQQGFADHLLITLAQLEHLTGQRSPLVRPEGARSSSSPIMTQDLENAIVHKLEGLQEILAKVDYLRLATFMKMLNVLDTYQKAQYLVVAAKLQATLHRLGLKLSCEDTNQEVARSS